MHVQIGRAQSRDPYVRMKGGGGLIYLLNIKLIHLVIKTNTRNKTSVFIFTSSEMMPEIVSLQFVSPLHVKVRS